MPLPNYNALNTLVGALAKIEIGDWVANYGVSDNDLEDQGLLNDIKVDEEEGELAGEYDNCLQKTDVAATSYIVKISGALGEFDLKRRAVVSGKAGTDVRVTPMVADTTDGTAILGMGTKAVTKPKKFVRLTVDGVSMKPGYSEAPTDVYTKVVYEFPRCVTKVKRNEVFKKNGIWVCGFEFEALWDNSVTTVGDEHFRIKQIMPHTVTPSA